MDEVSTFELSSSSSSSPANCNFGIELTRRVSLYEVTGRPQAWRMIVEVTNAYNMTPDIFLYQRTGPDPVTADMVDTFECMGSPVDIEEYPVGAPDPEQEPAFYRLSSIDVISRNRTLLDSMWTGLKQDRDELVRTMVGICQVGDAEISRYGYFEDDPVDQPTPELPKPMLQAPAPAPVFEGIKITESNDPDYPTGVRLELESSDELPPNYERRWTFHGFKTNTKLTIETSLTTHRYICYLAHSQVSTGKLANGYRAIINYVRDGSEHTIHIAGV
jgi:hypothetical protein